jgi:1-aminocyclopropane-1-carboxylate deaminase/D-cysteine desulfhydrase-like pyridoxal-dependent ACC family enzyme
MPTTGFPTLTPTELRERVARIPRIRGFALTPTPLEDLPRLSEAIGGPRILMKRDDLTGFAFGGNKVRAIEFRMADARAKGCDTLVLTNIGQSNHARIHAAACRRLGLKMVLVKPGPKGERVQGNLLLDHMLGAEIVEVGSDDPDTVERTVDEVIADLRKRGHTPYNVKREPFSRLAGTVAFAEAAIELLEQVAAAGAVADHVFLVGGTSAAGLALGGKLLGASYQVHPVSVGADRAKLLAQELDLSNQVCERLGLPPVMTESDFCVHDEYVGDEYGDAPPATLEAIRLAARVEGVFLDPVYTGKAFSGLIGEVRKGAVRKGETVVFVHTGGLPIIFAYDEVLGQL